MFFYFDKPLKIRVYRDAPAKLVEMSSTNVASRVNPGREIIEKVDSQAARHTFPGKIHVWHHCGYYFDMILFFTEFYKNAGK